MTQLMFEPHKCIDEKFNDYDHKPVGTVVRCVCGKLWFMHRRDYRKTYWKTVPWCKSWRYRNAREAAA